MRVDREPVAAAGRAEITRGRPAADRALDAVEGQCRGVALHRAAHRPQFEAARQHTAQRLERQFAARTRQHAAAKRFVRAVSCRADREAEQRAEIQRVHPELTGERRLVAARQCKASAHPRPGHRAVDVAEGQLLSGNIQPRRQTDGQGRQPRRRQVEHRCDIDLACCKRDRRFRLVGPEIRGALRVGIEIASREFRLETQRRFPDTGRSPLELRRTIAGRDRPIEAEQRQQRTALIGRKLAVDIDLAARQSIDIEMLQCGQCGLGGGARRALELRTVDLERGHHIGRAGTRRIDFRPIRLAVIGFGAVSLVHAIERERQFQFGDALRPGRRRRQCIQPRRERRRQHRRQGCGDLRQRGRVGFQADLAGGRRAIERAAALHRDAAGATEFQAGQGE